MRRLSANNKKTNALLISGPHEHHLLNGCVWRCESCEICLMWYFSHSRVRMGAESLRVSFCNGHDGADLMFPTVLCCNDTVIMIIIQFVSSNMDHNLRRYSILKKRYTLPWLVHELMLATNSCYHQSRVYAINLFRLLGFCSINTCYGIYKNCIPIAHYYHSVIVVVNCIRRWTDKNKKVTSVNTKYRNWMNIITDIYKGAI